MKNVLFFTYYFPPSGGPGVQRSLKFTKYLPEFGWQPTVVTVRPEHASYPDIDPKLVEEIPASVRVEQTSAWDPYALYASMLQKEKQDIVSVGFLGEADMNTRQRLARWVRANVFLPDARIGWVPFAAARGHALLRDGDYDAVVTTGPPHSTHLAGLILRHIHQKPWITDLRDPWTDVFYYADLPMSKAARAIDAWIERRVLQNASTAVVVSEAMGRQILASARTPIEIIENGFDPDDFVQRDAAPPAERFVIRHVGNLTHTQNPTAFWNALKRIDAPSNMPDLTVSFVGNVDPEVLKTASTLGLRDMVEIHPYVPHDQAIRFMYDSTLLLLAINRVPRADVIVTGKLFEYLAAGRHVLGIGPLRGDAARIVAETGAGQMFDYDDVDAIATYLRACYKSWKRGAQLRGAKWDRADRYSRQNQARRLARVLDDVSYEDVDPLNT